MKKYLLVIRWIVGLLFIFSGLIKANDPLGLSYKMQEFFEAWGLKGFHDFTLLASVGMNLLEVVAGVAVIVGWQMKRFSWLLLILIVFFTFLTSYVLFSGKIHACGCFGDCVPLSPIQTFTKDFILLLLIVVLFFKAHDVKPMFAKNIAFGIVLFSAIATIALQLYVQKYLPVMDCLPFAKGKNIADGMKLPANAVADSFAITFKYQKNGKELEFDQDHFPDDFDDSYVFVNRYDKLIRKGTGLPKITDFVLTTQFGNDTTKALLTSNQNYVLLFAKDLNNINKWKNGNLALIMDVAQKNKIPIFLVTADVATAQQQFSALSILSCDATIIKTAARVNPTYLFMKGSSIINKLSYANEKALLETINTIRN